jgi:hypothetical protein
MKFKVLIILLILNISSIQIFADAGKYSGTFIFLPATTRSAAMNNTLTANANDANAIFYNPAFLADDINNEMNFMHKILYADITHQSISGIYKLNQSSGIGIGINYINYGKINITEVSNGNPEYTENTNSAYGLLLNLSYGRKISDNFFTGAGLKLINESISGYSGNAYSLYIGTLYRINNRLQIGTYTDIITTDIEYKTKKEKVPDKYSLGLNYKILDNLNFNIEGIKLSDDSFKANTAFEYTLNNITLRNGITIGKEKEGRYSFGLGFKLLNIKIDYAYTIQSKLKNVHTFGLKYIFL